MSSSLAVAGLFLFLFWYKGGVDYSFFIPTAIPEFAEFDRQWPYLAFLLSMLMYMLSGLIWNQRMVQSEMLIHEEFSQIFNFTVVGAVVYFLCPSCILATSTFCISLALNRLFRINKNTDTAYAICFDSGLFIGIACFLVFPFILYIPFIWLAVLILKNLGFKEFFWSVVGLLFPYVFLGLNAQIFGWNFDFIPASFLGDLNFETVKRGDLILFYILSLLVVLLGYFVLARAIAKSSVRFKISINSLLVFFIFNLVFTGVLVGLNSFKSVGYFFIFLLPFFWQCNQQTKKRRILRSLLYVFWFVSVLIVILR